MTTRGLSGEAKAVVTVAGPATATVEPGEFGMQPDKGLFLTVYVTGVAAPDPEESFSINKALASWSL